MTKRHVSPASRGRRARSAAIDLSDSWEIASLPPRAAPYWMAIGRGRALGLSICTKTGRPLNWHPPPPEGRRRLPQETTRPLRLPVARRRDLAGPALVRKRGRIRRSGRPARTGLPAPGRSVGQHGLHGCARPQRLSPPPRARGLHVAERVQHREAGRPPSRRRPAARSPGRGHRALAVDGACRARAGQAQPGSPSAGAGAPAQGDPQPPARPAARRPHPRFRQPPDRLGRRMAPGQLLPARLGPGATGNLPGSHRCPAQQRPAGAAAADRRRAPHRMPVRRTVQPPLQGPHRSDTQARRAAGQAQSRPHRRPVGCRLAVPRIAQGRSGGGRLAGPANRRPQMDPQHHVGTALRCGRARRPDPGDQLPQAAPLYQ